MLVTKAAIYLDSNAGAPLRPSGVEALRSCLQGSSVLIPNPSSIHSQGRAAKRALAEARERIALSLGPKVDPEQLIFTSSGTEANQLAVRSVLTQKLLSHERPHWITTPVEHDSNRQLVSWVEKLGGMVSLLPLNSQGVPDVEALAALIQPNTALVSVIWVNNETGTLVDAKRFAEITQSKKVPLHLDAAQAWGKISLDLDTLGAQWVTFSGHKIGGLAGTGLLWVARGTGSQVASVISGKQEKGRRGGTENLLGMIALGAAAQELQPMAWSKRVEPLRDRLENVICHRIPGTHVNGQSAPRVANTLNLNFDGVEGEGLVMALDLAGYSVSSGSACASGVLEPSHVLLALGLNKSQAMSAIRISLADEMPWEVLEGFVDALERVVLRMRGTTRWQS